ncbi:MAG: amicyanin, partial [Nitrosopumilales archaeon]
LTIEQGEKVKWENTDVASHTITSGNPDDNQTGTIFDSGLFAAGKSHEITFNEKGDHPYFCQLHPWEIGKIIVE